MKVVYSSVTAETQRLIKIPYGQVFRVAGRAKGALMIKVQSTLTADDYCSVVTADSWVHTMLPDDTEVVVLDSELHVNLEFGHFQNED